MIDKSSEKKHDPYTESPNSPGPKRGEIDEEQSQEHFYYFL
jgi:hypothetical protein